MKTLAIVAGLAASFAVMSVAFGYADSLVALILISISSFCAYSIGRTDGYEDGKKRGYISGWFKGKYSEIERGGMR